MTTARRPSERVRGRAQARPRTDAHLTTAPRRSA